MNKKRKGFHNSKDKKEVSEIGSLLSMLTSLEMTARLYNCYDILRQIEKLKKSAATNNGNKKLLKSINNKYFEIKQQMEEIMQNRQNKIK